MHGSRQYTGAMIDTHCESAAVEKTTITNTQESTMNVLSSLGASLRLIREKISGPKAEKEPGNPPSVPMGQLGMAMDIRSYAMVLDKMAADILSDL